ncbi:MAG TPA: hypothetical protein VFS05_09035 [Gemmatimonadaceae bacterium]|nr:hypothetical protein [Gemmatimonadaceae bacterium]
MHRSLVLASLLLAACARRTTTVSEGRLAPTVPEAPAAAAVFSDQRTVLATAAIPNSALAAAAQQLESHGYAIGARQGDLMITTAARPLPEGLDTAGVGTTVDRWVMRVDALRDTAGTTTDLRVVGFLIPVDSSAAAVPITPRQRPLFIELQRAASWLQEVLPASQRRTAGSFDPGW